MAQRPFATDFQDRRRTLAVLPTTVASRSEIDSLTMWRTILAHRQDNRHKGRMIRISGA